MENQVGKNKTHEMEATTFFRVQGVGILENHMEKHLESEMGAGDSRVM